MLRLHPNKAPRAFQSAPQRGLFIDLRDPEQPVVFAIAETDQDAKSLRIEAETSVPCILCGRGLVKP